MISKIAVFCAFFALLALVDDVQSAPPRALALRQRPDMAGAGSSCQCDEQGLAPHRGGRVKRQGGGCGCCGCGCGCCGCGGGCGCCCCRPCCCCQRCCTCCRTCCCTRCCTCCRPCCCGCGCGCCGCGGGRKRRALQNLKIKLADKISAEQKSSEVSAEVAPQPEQPVQPEEVQSKEDVKSNEQETEEPTSSSHEH